MKIITLILLTLTLSLSAISLDTVLGRFDQKLSQNRLSQRLGIPHSIVADNNGDIYIVDTAANKIRKIVKDNKVITVVGSNYEGDTTGSPLKVNLKLPLDITFDSENNMIIADTYNNKIKKFINNKVITIAGTGEQKFNGDGKALEKNIFYPKDITYYKNEIYFIDAGNNLIRKIDKKGNIKTILGNGKKSFDSYFIGKATDLKLNNPTAIAFDKNGKLYIAEKNGTYILKINLTNNKVIHFAGNGKIGSRKRVRVGWYPTETHIGIINSIYIKKEIVYLVSSSHNSIFYIKKGRIESLVDYIDNKAHFKKDDMAYLPLNYPTDILIKDDDIYIADKRNNYIRTIKNGIISIFVGFWNAKKEIKKLYYPNSITLNDKFSYIADTLNYRILQLDNKFKNPYVVAGTGIKGFFEEFENHFAKDVNIGFVTSISVCKDMLYLIGEGEVWKIRNQILKKLNIKDPIDIACKDNKLIVLTNKSILSIDNEKITTILDLDLSLAKKIVSSDKIYIINDKKIYLLKDKKLNEICKTKTKKEFNEKSIKCDNFEIKNPVSFAVNADTIYYYDSVYSKIFAIKDNIVYHIAGNGKKGFNKFDGEATELSLNDPLDFSVKDKKLYFTDSSNNLVRVIDLKTISFKEKKDIKEKVKENKKTEEKTGCNYSDKSSFIFLIFFLFVFLMKRKRYDL